MKYCTKCGEPLVDEAVVCPRCGCAAPAPASAAAVTVPGVLTTLQVITLVFMILGCISSGWALIPLLWTIPMTLSYNRRAKAHQPIGLGFKICTLLFVNMIAGILMICDSDLAG